MDNRQADLELKRLIESRLELIMSYRRKKSWKESEKAMAVASVHQTIDALRLARDCLRKELFAKGNNE
jgi:hypothetical protein